MAVETLLAARNRGAHALMLMGFAIPIADILGDLRQRVEAMANHRNRLADLLDHRQDLQGRDEAVAGRGVVRQDDMARRLAAEIDALLAHLLEHIAVADLDTMHLDPEPVEMALQAEIRHDGGDEAGLCQPPVLVPTLRDYGEQLIAVDQMAELVHDHDAVGIAVERDTDIGAQFQYLAAERLGFGRTAILVNVEAVRIDPDGDHFGAEFPQRIRNNPVRGAVCAVDHDPQSLE